MELDCGVEASSEPDDGLGPEKGGVLAEGDSGDSKSQETPCLRQLPQVG